MPDARMPVIPTCQSAASPESKQSGASATLCAASGIDSSNGWFGGVWVGPFIHSSKSMTS